VSGLPANPTGAAASKIVVASNTALHQAYVFYIKASDTVGSSNGYFGPYTMNVGCFSGSVTFTDSGSFITNVALHVGDLFTNVYTFHVPTANRAWCVITANEIVNTNNALHDGSKIA
jgi:hypothetical protein